MDSRYLAKVTSQILSRQLPVQARKQSTRRADLVLTTLWYYVEFQQTPPRDVRTRALTTP